jgi:hypothetical protein
MKTTDLNKFNGFVTELVAVVGGKAVEVNHGFAKVVTAAGEEILLMGPIQAFKGTWTKYNREVIAARRAMV